MNTPLDSIRTVIARLDEAIVSLLCQRGAYARNWKLYRPVEAQTPWDVSARHVAAHVVSIGAQTRRAVDVLHADYVMRVLPVICRADEDDMARKCIAIDHDCLDAVARRLHLATVVASRKKQDNIRFIQALERGASDTELEEAITHPAIEEEVLRRIRLLADAANAQEGTPDRILTVYREWLIPLSRRVQVEFLQSKGAVIA
jgi:chorismate mutase